VLLDVVAVGADGVALGAVRAQDVRVAVQALEGVGATAVLLEIGAIEDVVWLVGPVHDIAPDESSSNSIARGRSAVQAGGDLGASTGSSKDIAHDPGALREAVEDELRARALLVEVDDLTLAVGNASCDLGAVVAVLHGVEDNLDEIAGLALSPQLAACSVDEGEGTAVLVRGIVAAGHDDNGIGTGSVGLGGRARDLLSDGDGGESAERESVADDGRHY